MRDSVATAAGGWTIDEASEDLTNAALVVRGVNKEFRLQHNRMLTFKQRVLHPRQRGYEMLHALDDVTLQIDQGDFFGIVGRNGSGKSTLLKCMAGIYLPNSGQIAVRGKLSTFIELGVGFNPELTARDNVILNATLLGLTSAEAASRFDEIIDFAELEGFVDMKLKNYSSGMHVRLAFSVAMHVSADVFLIDEVLAVGDAAFQRKCLSTFREMRKAGRTVVLVTHDMSMVERLCNRAVMLDSGRIVAEGEPKDVARRYLEANFDRAAPVDPDSVERWGDGSARVEECWLEDDAGKRSDQFEQGDWMTIRARVRFVRAMQDPIVGVTIVNEEGGLIFQTNTLLDHVQAGDFEPGDELEYVLRVANHSERGPYFISPSVTDQSGLQTAEWCERMRAFVVTASKHTGAAANYPHECTVERSPRPLEAGR